MPSLKAIFGCLSRFGETFISGEADNYTNTSQRQPRYVEIRGQQGFAVNPLTDLILRFPNEAALLIRVAMLMGIICAVMSAAPMVLYLHDYWDMCRYCSTPLRGWLVVMTAFQLAQAPLRLCFFKRVNEIIDQHAPVAYVRAESDSSANSDEVRDATLSNPSFTGSNMEDRGIQNAIAAPSAGWQRTQAAQELTDRRVSSSLMSMTHSAGWRISLWLSGGSYVWLLIGAVWAFSEETGACRWSGLLRRNKQTSEPFDDVWDNDDDLIERRVFNPDDGTRGYMNIQAVIILSILISVIRLVLIIGLFYIYVPPGASDERPRRRRRNAVSFFDDNRRYDPVSSSWTSFAQNRQRPRRYSQTNLFESRETESSEDTETSSFVMLENFIRAVGSRRRNRDDSTSIAEFFELIDSLPVSYFSHHVFPSTLKAPGSLEKVRNEFLRSCSSSCFLGGPFMKDRRLATNEFPKCEETEHFSRGFRRDWTTPAADLVGRLTGVRHRRKTFLKLTSDFQQHVGGKPTARRSLYSNIPKKFFETEIAASPPLYLPSCPICFEEFEEGSELRQLPCRHGFHRSCIDVWLLHKRTCPLCQMSFYCHDAPVVFPDGNTPYD